MPTKTAPKNSAPAEVVLELPAVTINVPVPAEIHRKLRVKAITDGHAMKDEVVLAIAAWV